MQIYLVGGAVRDRLLNIESHALRPARSMLLEEPRENQARVIQDLPVISMRMLPYKKI